MATEDISEEMQRGKNLADLQESHRNEPARITESLKTRLAEGGRAQNEDIKNFDKGGLVKRTGTYQLAEGEHVSPASNSAQDSSDQTVASAPQGVRLHKDYAAVNESLVRLCDTHVPRSFTIPYLAGEEMSNHVASIGKTAATVGGLTRNLVLTHHDSGGRGYGSEDGQTTGFDAQKLHEVIIPPKSAEAAEVLQKTQRYINDIASLLGKKNPAVAKSQSVLDLLKKTNAGGMTLQHLCVAVIGLCNGPTKAIAQAHSGAKPGGHAPHLRAAAPQSAQAQPAQAPQSAQQAIAAKAAQVPQIGQ